MPRLWRFAGDGISDEQGEVFLAVRYRRRCVLPPTDELQILASASKPRRVVA